MIVCQNSIRRSERRARAIYSFLISDVITVQIGMHEVCGDHGKLSND